jgi:membrane associated rhomboid family serine protease
MTFIVILLVVSGGLAYLMTSSDQRNTYLAIAIDAVWRLKVAATEPGQEHDLFYDALRARMSYVFVTAAIAVISATVLIGMWFGTGAIGNPATLVSWGASLGTRTTNGEWWRLVTSTFVHTGTLHLLVDVAVLIQLGRMLERLVGRLTVAAVYFSAGAFTGLVNLSSHPLAVTVGASGAVFGLYGLLLASLIWQVFHVWRHKSPSAGNAETHSFVGPAARLRSWMIRASHGEAKPQGRARRLEAGPHVSSAAPPDAVPLVADVMPTINVPFVAMKRLGAGAAVFLAYSALSGFAGAAEFTGLLVGLMYGLVLARRLGAKGPRTRHIAFAMTAAGAIAVACAVALRNIADVKPEIARVLAIEERTAAAYRKGFDAFKSGRMSGNALAQLAEGTILPELQAADARLQTLTNVPPEHQAVVSDAREYLRLRCASWRAHADAIRKIREHPSRVAGEPANASWRLQAEARFRSNLAATGSVESAERASLEAYQRIKQAPLRH